IQLKIEREALKKESDKASLERLSKLEEEIEKLEREYHDLEEIWNSEKAAVQGTQHIKEELERAHSLIQPIMAKLKDAGVSATCEARHGHAAELLCSIAEEKKACQLIIGRTSGSSFAQRLLGGVAITLAQVSPVPLTIVP
ncbi:MAG: universal stress protein, partial [Limibacillus sp.]